MIGDNTRVTVVAIRRHRAEIRVATNSPREDELHTATLVPGKPLYMPGYSILLRSTSRGQAKLGFKAPRNVPIHRQEVYDRIAAEHSQ